jgi:hypothetical protein
MEISGAQDVAWPHRARLAPACCTTTTAHLLDIQLDVQDTHSCVVLTLSLLPSHTGCCEQVVQFMDNAKKLQSETDERVRVVEERNAKLEEVSCACGGNCALLCCVVLCCDVM